MGQTKVKRIIALTSIRSEYDLMSGLYKKINDDPEMELGLIISGAHLSETYGYTVQYIEKDNLPILARIDSLFDSNSPASRLKSASVLLQCCIHTIESFQPDLILLSGDREDVIIGALVGAYVKIPTVHFFGGDHATDGNVDNPIRHATSKLSSLHFVSHESHVERLLKMGERKPRIFKTGSPALDKYQYERLIGKNALLEILGQPDWEDYAIVIFHPILGDEDNAGKYFEDILAVLLEMKIPAFVSYPNTDAGNKKIIKIIEEYFTNPHFVFYKNLNRAHFVNLMRHALFLIGNSSAGIIEAPVIPLGVINVGNRQKGRYAAENVLFVEQNPRQIKIGIEQLLSDNFKEKMKQVKSPYGDGKSVDRAYNLIKSLDIKNFMNKTEDPLYNE